MIDLLLVSGLITPDALGDTEYFTPFTYTVPVASIYESLKDDYSIRVFIPDVTRDIYKIPEAKVYGLSITFPEMVEAKKIIQHIRSKYPASKIVVGGEYASAFEKDVFEFLGVDYVVRGNGVEAMRHIMRGETYANVSTPRASGTVISDRSEISSSSILDKEAFVGIDWEGVKNNVYCDNEFRWIVTNSGCLYNCTFCTNKSFSGQKIKYGNIDRAIRDINLHLEENPKSRIFLTEPLFSARIKSHREYAFKMFERMYNETLIAKGNDVGVFCRLSELDDELLGLFEKYSDKFSYSLLVGIDNFSDTILDDMKKHETKAGLLNAFDRLKDKSYINSICGNIILGTPKDTEAVYQENLETTYDLFKMYKDSSTSLKFSATALWLLPGSQYYADRNLYGDIYIADPDISKQIRIVDVDGEPAMNIGLQDEWFVKHYRQKKDYHSELRNLKGRK